jgi:hypothetical protein
MTAVWLAWRTDLRARWRVWAAVGVLIGLLFGLVLAAAAGARRTDRAYPQLVAASNQADDLVFDSEPNPQVPTINGARVESFGQVAQAGHLRAFEVRESVDPFGSPAGNAFMTAGGVNRAHVVTGHAFREGQRDAVMIDFTLAEQDHLGPGSRLTLHFLRPMPRAPWLADYAARPVAVSFRVAGVVATPGQFPPQTNDYFSGPAVYLTPAFVNAHRHDLASYDVSVVRLKPGGSGAFAAAAARLEGTGQPPDMGGPASDVPGRSTIAGAILGVAAVVAALTFGASLTHLTSTPRLYGVSWDAEILNGNGPAAVRAAIPVLRRSPGVAAQAWLVQGVSVTVDGEGDRGSGG